jgi:hypothetical protein
MAPRLASQAMSLPSKSTTSWDDYGRSRSALHQMGWHDDGRTQPGHLKMRTGRGNGSASTTLGGNQDRLRWPPQAARAEGTPRTRTGL